MVNGTKDPLVAERVAGLISGQFAVEEVWPLLDRYSLLSARTLDFKKSSFVAPG